MADCFELHLVIVMTAWNLLYFYMLYIRATVYIDEKNRNLREEEHRRFPSFRRSMQIKTCDLNET